MITNYAYADNYKRKLRKYPFQRIFPIRLIQRTKSKNKKNIYPARAASPKGGKSEAPFRGMGVMIP